MDLWYFYKGECFKNCPSGLYESADSGNCEPCSDNCLTCQVSSENCLTCKPYFTIS
jgi:hypothetical protein